MSLILEAFRKHGIVATSGYISDGTSLDVLPAVVPRLDNSVLATAEDAIPSNDTVLPEGSAVRERTGELRSCFGIHRFSEPFRKIAFDPVLLEFAANIVGRPVSLYQSHLNIKQSRGGGHYSFHRDATYFAQRDGLLDVANALGVAISLCPIHDLMGPLVTIIGSHHSYLPVIKSQVVAHDLRHDNNDDIGIVSKATLECEPGPEHVFVSDRGGEMVFFDPRCIHGSAQNLSSRARPLLLLFFAPQTDFPLTVFDGNPFLHEVK